MFDMVEFGTPEQIQYAVDYYKENGYPPYCLAISEPEAGSANQYMTTTATKNDGKIHINGTKTWVTSGENSDGFIVVCKNEDPEAGSANQYMTTTATKNDGKIHINGTKTWVTSGENSDGFIVVCKNEDPSPENKQMSMYLVPANAKGVTIEPLNKIGMQIMPFSKVIFDDVVVDESALLGIEGKGFLQLMKNFEWERCVLLAELLGEAQAAMDDACAWTNERQALLGIEGKGFLQLMKNFEWERCVLLAELLGEAQAAMDDACAWTNERQQFGKGIKTFQLVQEHIVEMQIELTNTRNFLYRTCWKMDNGIPVNNDAAMLKRYGAPALTDCCSRALQLMGGLGRRHAEALRRPGAHRLLLPRPAAHGRPRLHRRDPRLPPHARLPRLPDRRRHRRDYGAHLRPRHPQGVRQGCRGSGLPLDHLNRDGDTALMEGACASGSLFLCLESTWGKRSGRCCSPPAARFFLLRTRQKK